MFARISREGFAAFLILSTLAAPLTGRAAAAAADDVGETVKLDPFVVTDANSLKTTLPVRPVAGVYGFETPYQDIPRSITQISPQQFEQDVIQSYSDFVRYSPSVNQSTGQLANYGSPTIRGSITDVYQNGVRMLVRQQNNRPFTLNAYEAADIVAGPAPVIYGPSARTSGYVNYLTKKPYFDGRHTTVTLRLGNLYLDSTGFKDNENITVDTGGPIIPGKLAYRVSYQAENQRSYYNNVWDRFQDVYGTLAWVPNSNLTIDWNFEYGTFDWRVNNSLNRVTNEFIRDGTYLSGPATPIIRVGTALYSPVLNGSGAVTGWITRTQSGTKYLPGIATGDPTSNSTAGAGTIVGYVLDPANVRSTQLDGNSALNAPGFPSTTEAFNTQLRVKQAFSPDLTLLSNTIYQYYNTDTASNGGFYNWIRSQTLETRLEGLFQKDYALFSVPVRHRTNTGVSYRFEHIRNYKDGQLSGYGPTGDWYDLGADPTTYTRNAFFGAQVYPFTGTTSTPVLTRFGYLKGFWTYLTVPESPANAVSPGGTTTGTYGGNLSSTTNETRTHSGSIYTQHSLQFGEKVILDAGFRETRVSSEITNPLPLDASFAGISDSIATWLPSWSASLSYKPVPRLTAYATYAEVEAQNGMTTGSPTWATVNGVPNQYNPDNFHSGSDLRELGAKFELVPGKLLGGLAVYRQTRDLTFTAVAGQDPILAKGRYQGVEFNLRFQPVQAFSAGFNYTYLDAVTLNQNISVANGVVADNATNIIGSTSKGIGNWRVTNLPRNNVTVYANYRFASGFGLKADLWARDEYLAANEGTVTVPAEFQLNLGVSYARPTWSAEVNIQNVTNERNFAGGSTLLEPTSLQGRFVYRF